MKKIPSELYGMIWIDVEDNPSSKCSWDTHDDASNCKFIMDIIKRIEFYGKKCGVYTNKYMWEKILGSRYAC